VIKKLKGTGEIECVCANGEIAVQAYKVHHALKMTFGGPRSVGNLHV